MHARTHATHSHACTQVHAHTHTHTQRLQTQAARQAPPSQIFGIKSSPELISLMSHAACGPHQMYNVDYLNHSECYPGAMPSAGSVHETTRKIPFLAGNFLVDTPIMVLFCAFPLPLLLEPQGLFSATAGRAWLWHSCRLHVHGCGRSVRGMGMGVGMGMWCVGWPLSQAALELRHQFSAVPKCMGTCKGGDPLNCQYYWAPKGWKKLCKSYACQMSWMLPLRGGSWVDAVNSWRLLDAAISWRFLAVPFHASFLAYPVFPWWKNRTARTNSLLCIS